jgi:hypothetical protein
MRYAFIQNQLLSVLLPVLLYVTHVCIDHRLDSASVASLSASVPPLEGAASSGQAEEGAHFVSRHRRLVCGLKKLTACLV